MPITSKHFVVLDDPAQPEVHASTVLVVGENVYVAWFGGTKEGHADVKIWFSKAGSDHHFTAPSAVSQHSNITHWNPVLFHPPSAPPSHIHLFYKTGSPIPSWKTHLITSVDSGSTWSPSVELVPGDTTGGRGPVKNPLLVASNGDWIAGASREQVLDDGRWKWDAFADISPASDGAEQGQRWIKSADVPLPADRGLPGSSFKGEGIIQPTLYETTTSTTGAATIHMLTRSSSGYIISSTSPDFGRSWTPAVPTTIPNNNSGLCACKMRNGLIVLVHNPVAGSWGARTPLVATISEDDGRSWKGWLMLEDKPVPEGFKGVEALATGIVSNGESEFSYPTVIPTDPSDEIGVWISYTWQRRGIVVVRCVYP